MFGIIQSRKCIYFFAILASISLSFLAAMKGIVINPDGICYLQSAESIPMGWSVVTHLCDQAKWPFYSLLIFSVSKITTLSSLHSAYLLDGFFSLISIVTFIAIIRFLKGSLRVLWFAALVILLAHEFNVVREYVIRDHGFWAFYLLSILFLLRFFKKPCWCYALLWNSSLIIAALFRVEGIFFLLLAPVFTWFGTRYDFRSFLKLNTLSLIGIALLAVWFFWDPHGSSEHSGRLGEVKLQVLNGWDNVLHHFHLSTRALKQHILNRYLAQDAAIVWFLMMVFFYLISVIGNLSLIYAVLVIYAWYYKIPPLEKSSRWVVWSYIVINVAVTVAFFAENLFLSKRYLLALSLTFMIWIPFALEQLYQRLPQRKWPFILAVFFILMSALGGVFDFGYSKKYIRDASHWLHVHLPPQATLYSNDYLVMYYSSRFGNDIFQKAREFSRLGEEKWKEYDYVALRFNKKEQQAVDTKKWGVPVQLFKNKRGDEVLIFKKRGEL